MATRETVQEGNYVSMDSKGKRTSVPMSQRPAEPAPRAKTAAMGASNKLNDEARKAAGMKAGGAVRGYGAARKPMKKGGSCR